MSPLSYTEIPLKSSFAPAIDADACLLILGSLPGEASLAAGQYYAHPRNQFWRLLGDVLDVDLVRLDYPGRLQTLKQHRIAVWDVVAQARRQGSLDSQLRDVAVNDFTRVLQLAPGLRAVGCNGGEAWKRASRFEDGWFVRNGLQLLALPSSSPALTLPYEKKRDIWLQLKEFL